MYLRTIWAVVGDTFVHIGVTNLSINTNERTHCRNSVLHGNHECQNKLECVMNSIHYVLVDFHIIITPNTDRNRQTRNQKCCCRWTVQKLPEFCSLGRLTWWIVLIHTFHFFAFPLYLSDDFCSIQKSNGEMCTRNKIYRRHKFFPYHTIKFNNIELHVHK